MNRLEDADLVTGKRQFLADLPTNGAAHAVFVRSPLAHGTIRNIDVSDAVRQAGVLTVETSESLGLGPFVLFESLPIAMTDRPLATRVVRHVGQPVAVVVATTLAAAVDAAEMVDVDIDPLPAVVAPTDSPGADPIYTEAGTNIVYTLPAESDADPLPSSDRNETDLIVELSITNPRVASAPLECDGILATPIGDRLDIWCTSQGAQDMRNQLATALQQDPASLRVRSPAVGGGFGGRATATPEFVVVAQLAQKLGKPVRWIQSRYENLTGMAQGRGHVTTMRLGLTDDGHITGIDAEAVADSGSSAHMAGLLMVSARRQLPGMYRVPAMRWSGQSVLTTTTPVGAYRGAGQPEANHARERLLDIASHRLRIDPIELRRRNLPDANDFPLRDGEVEYDSGRPIEAMDRAIELARVDARRAEQATRRASDSEIELGIGIANYAQTSGRGAPSDSALIQVRADGSVLVGCASPSHGQGHLTTWATLVADQLGVDVDVVQVVDADSDLIERGQSTGGSRSSQVAASAIVNACGDVVDQARPLAAERLEAAEADLEVVAAGFGLPAGLAVAGVPTQRITWAEMAQSQPNSCLDATRHESVAAGSYPYGTHVSVVEVDTNSGQVTLIDHVAVDDCGTVLQPTLVAGQQHGGSVAGISQALFEAISYDGYGNAETATFASYLLPAASEMCSIVTDTMATPTDNNQLGTRGIGENGCNGATAAVHNAVIDALNTRGIEHIDMPLSPERIWTALEEARAGARR